MNPDPQQLLATGPAHPAEEPPPRYEATPTGTVALVPDKDGQLRDQPLANFNARIVRAVTIDDGEEAHAFLDVEVVVGNRTYVARNLPARDFESLSWVAPTTCGRGIIEPRRNARDGLRHAI